MPEGEFALCLTHDVDRPYKSLYQSLYYAVRERRARHLETAVSGRNPYWQFEEIMALEEELGVRSAFYFLHEPHLLRERGPGEWLQPECWIQHLGRYDPRRDDVAAVIRRLDDGGWEVGLHGSRCSSLDERRLRYEKRVVEDVLGHPITGGRQHYLRVRIPDTWRYQATAGLAYDASLGSSTEYGFQYGYDVLRPFGDEFAVFPLTLMEVALPDPGSRFEAAWDACERLLEEAAANDAVMTVLWHPRYFSEEEFPGYRRLYRRLVDRAAGMGAWIGPPADLYRQLPPGDGRRPTEGIEAE